MKEHGGYLGTYSNRRCIYTHLHMYNLLGEVIWIFSSRGYKPGEEGRGTIRKRKKGRANKNPNFH